MQRAATLNPITLWETHMTISSESEAAAAKWLAREDALHKAFKPQHELLFGDFSHAIVDLEDAVEARECVRWQRNDRHYFDDYADMTYGGLDAKVREARRRVVDEAIKLAASGIVRRTRKHESEFDDPDELRL
jgi:hypothetical protein